MADQDAETESYFFMAFTENEESWEVGISLGCKFGPEKDNITTVFMWLSSCELLRFRKERNSKYLMLT